MRLKLSSNIKNEDEDFNQLSQFYLRCISFVATSMKMSIKTDYMTSK